MKMMRKGLVILLAFMGLTISACGQSTAEERNDLGAVAQTIRRVSKQEFKDYLTEHPAVTLIDVRTPVEYAAGTIAHARNIDFYAPSFRDEINKLDKREPVLLFCMSGGRSSKALQIMKNLGFEYVLELEGGYRNY